MLYVLLWYISSLESKLTKHVFGKTFWDIYAIIQVGSAVYSLDNFNLIHTLEGHKQNCWQNPSFRQQKSSSNSEDFLAKNNFERRSLENNEIWRNGSLHKKEKMELDRPHSMKRQRRSSQTGLGLESTRHS